MTVPKTVPLKWLKSPISHTNNFDLLRLGAALQVVIGHCEGRLHPPAPDWIFTLFTFFPGVPIFFFLSGMLVTSSLASSRTLMSFYRKRVRRIFPALWLAVALAILLLAAFHQITRPLLFSAQFWVWLLAQLTFIQFYNPDFFRHFATGVVNGSLWTISVELGFYLVLPFLCLWAGRDSAGVRTSAPFRKLQTGLLVSVLASYALFAYLAAHGNMAASGPKAALWIRAVNQTFVPHFWLFGLGMLAYLHYSKLQSLLVGKAFGLLFAYLVLCSLGTAWNWLGEPVPLFLSRLLLCLTILALGASTKPVSQSLLRGWDISYGLYVFHMLVINVFVALRFTGSWLDVAGVLVIALTLAALSWKFVERPITQGKRPQPGKAVPCCVKPEETAADTAIVFTNSNTSSSEIAR